MLRFEPGTTQAKCGALLQLTYPRSTVFGRVMFTLSYTVLPAIAKLPIIGPSETTATQTQIQTHA